ncbi:MAG TPA: ribonuclease P protein subunit [Euryarchaeota archaeon]|nr:ribonuclease P protein component 1 [archaeon]HEQ78240.1 ribonuclease P protein subunit [Euryarchaeota archaeon]
MRTHNNIVKHELIGLTCTVVESGNPTIIGLTGTVVYETRNMLHIDVEGQLKKIPKEHSIFLFKIEDDEVKVEGRKILARPEDRIKR